MKIDIEYEQEKIETLLHTLKSNISYSDIFYSVFDLEVQLLMHLPKMAWNGLKIHYDLHASKRGAKSIQQDILYTVERWRNRWYLVDIRWGERRSKVIELSCWHDKETILIKHAIKMIEKG